MRVLRALVRVVWGCDDCLWWPAVPFDFCCVRAECLRCGRRRTLHASIPELHTCGREKPL